MATSVSSLTLKVEKDLGLCGRHEPLIASSHSGFDSFAALQTPCSVSHCIFKFLYVCFLSVLSPRVSTDLKQASLPCVPNLELGSGGWGENDAASFGIWGRVAGMSPSMHRPPRCRSRLHKHKHCPALLCC